MSHLIADSRISPEPFDPFAPTPAQAEAMDRLAQQGYDPWPDALINHPQFIADMNAREQELAEHMGLSAQAGSLLGHDVLFVTCPSESRDADDSDADLVDDWQAAHLSEWRERCDREAAEAEMEVAL